QAPIGPLLSDPEECNLPEWRRAPADELSYLVDHLHASDVDAQVATTATVVRSLLNSRKNRDQPRPRPTLLPIRQDSPRPSAGYVAGPHGARSLRHPPHARTCCASAGARSPHIVRSGGRLRRANDSRTHQVA